MKTPHEPTIKELRQFGLILAFILFVLFVVIPFFRDKSPTLTAVSIIVILVLWALVLPASMKHLFKLWMMIGELLGWVNTRIILGVVFVVLFLPVSIMMRLMGKDPLHLSLTKDATSYRVASTTSPPEQLERPY